MTAQVIFLCQWIDCPDDKQREHWAIQNKVKLARAKLFYDIRVLGVNEFQAQLCYDRWVHANRDQLKIADKYEENDEKD